MVNAQVAIWSSIFGGFAGAIVGGFVIVFGNHYVQLDRRRLYLTDGLKQQFYYCLELSAQYWLPEQHDSEERHALEAKITSAQHIAMADYRLMAEKYPHMRKSHEDTDQLRRDLMDALSGGCFQQKDNWSPNRERFLSASKIVVKIIDTFWL